MRYFITFACYGTHLHGGESGSVDRHNNVPGGRSLKADWRRETAEQIRMNQPPYLLDRAARDIVLSTIRKVCAHRGWGLLASPVRTNHVHAAVEANVAPEKVMNDFKSYASRALNQMNCDGQDRKRWARHGSTRWLWKDRDVQEAIRYVVEEQGQPMAVFVADMP